LEQHHLGASGVFNAELNEFLARTLGEDGYAGVEVRVTPIRTEIIIRATRTQVETVEHQKNQTFFKHLSRLPESTILRRDNFVKLK
jgi:hypothetical protein